MAKQKLIVKFEKPPVHVTATGSLCINADDIFHSQAGQDVILSMTTMGTASRSKEERESTHLKKPRR